MTNEIIRLTGLPKATAHREVIPFAEKYESLPKKDLIAEGITKILANVGCKMSKSQLRTVIKGLKGRLLKCYAGKLIENRAGKIKGYPACFEHPEMFPGRMTDASKWKDMIGTARPEKPWLNGFSRLVFVSDMGDALCSSIPFEYLHREIVETCTSPKGRRHVWLWLTKRPARMAELSAWLHKRGVVWPDNLVAMTTVTSTKTLCRVADLRMVKCRYRGLSVEPLWSAVNLPLDGIQWVIVGGESGPGAKPFHLEWARDIREQCRRAGVAFFMKQLGRYPTEAGRELTLRNKHGGDWTEWPDDLRVREIPQAFRLTTQ